MEHRLPPLRLLKNIALKTQTYDLAQELPSELTSAFSDQELNGKHICICVGSRYIKEQLPVLKTLINFLKTKSAEVTIIPAMGSHGGATSEGQLHVLASYGVTEETMGVPIFSDVIPIALPIENKTLNQADLHNIFIDRHAMQADGIILINRVKPHTSFAGPLQSGLCKMCCIGLGKARGAAAYHQVFDTLGFSESLPLLVQEILRNAPIIGGIALIENGIANLAHVKVLKPEQFLDEEPKLLALAIEQMPHIPADTADILIVDEIGKGVSGSGMDTNIIGKKQDIFHFHPKLIYARKLAPGSGGNAVGMGLSDIIHANMIQEVDFQASYINAETSLSPGSVKIPINYSSDQRCWDALLRMAGHTETKNPTVVWIKNSGDLKYILTNLSCPTSCQIEQENLSIPFDNEGDLPNFLDIVNQYSREH